MHTGEPESTAIKNVTDIPKQEATIWANPGSPEHGGNRKWYCDDDRSCRTPSQWPSI